MLNISPFSWQLLQQAMGGDARYSAGLVGGGTATRTCQAREGIQSFIILSPGQTDSEVNTSGWPNETQVERKSRTCLDLRVRLANWHPHTRINQRSVGSLQKTAFSNYGWHSIVIARGVASL